MDMPAVGLYELIIIGAVVIGLLALVALLVIYLLRRDKN
jgi:hypothetical protein